MRRLTVARGFWAVGVVTLLATFVPVLSGAFPVDDFVYAWWTWVLLGTSLAAAVTALILEPGGRI